MMTTCPERYNSVLRSSTKLCLEVECQLSNSAEACHICCVGKGAGQKASCKACFLVCHKHSWKHKVRLKKCRLDDHFLLHKELQSQQSVLYVNALPSGLESLQIENTIAKHCFCSRTASSQAQAMETQSSRESTLGSATTSASTSQASAATAEAEAGLMDRLAGDATCMVVRDPLLVFGCERCFCLLSHGLAYSKCSMEILGGDEPSRLQSSLPIFSTEKLVGVELCISTPWNPLKSQISFWSHHCESTRL